MKRQLLTLTALASLILSPIPGWAAPPAEQYLKPVAILEKLVDAASPPELRVDPRGQWLLQCQRAAYLSIDDLAQPELKLAGVRFSPDSRVSRREKFFTSLSIGPLRGASKAVSGLPMKARISRIYWSPDGSKAAFACVGDKSSQLYILEAASAIAKPVAGLTLNGWSTADFDINWLPDSQQLIVLGNPQRVGPVPSNSAVPSGPAVQEHKGGKASARTFQDLLKSSYDEQLFEYYTASQVYLVAASGGSVKAVTPTGSYDSVTPSPDGKYLLLKSVHRPYSYSQTVSSFPHKTEVVDLQGRPIKVIADLVLEENVPPDNDTVRVGRREIRWRQDAPSTLFWVETQDQGDARKVVNYREQLYLWPVGSGEPISWLKLKYRFRRVYWGDGKHALVQEQWYKTRKDLVHLTQPDSPSAEPVTIIDRSSEDRYSDPGTPILKTASNGTSVLLMGADNDSVYFEGLGATPAGEKPFVDLLHFSDQKKERIFQSAEPFFERASRFLSPSELLFMKESVDSPPNLFVRNLSSNKDEQLTQFSHPAPEMKGVQKQILRYKRADGVNLTGTLYTPPGYDPKKDGRLPIFVWAYPGEFKSAASAGQIKDSPYKYVRPFWGGPLFFAMRGYAVLQDPTFPIIGEGKQEPNDTYVEQLVMNAKAALDAVADIGVGDLDRCAIGGHSYGAFTTANLLAHSDLFRAGIARSGAYNRTLTPFGFQSEERNYWEAQKTYTRMAPFTYANKIDEPLLLIHGAEDSNPGTFPVQSERLFAAIKGLGGQVRLVMLPKESHSYAARESVLHTFYEMDNWLETHVKNAKPRVPKPVKDSELESKPSNEDEP